MKTYPLSDASSYPEAWSYEFLAEGIQGSAAPRSCLLSFEGVADDTTVYNPCPFVKDGAIALLGRVEARTSEIAHVFLFTKENPSPQWHAREQQFLHVQDPFLAVVAGTVTVGGVELSFDETTHAITDYRTVFWDFESKERLATGPSGMKDIRLTDMGGTIGVFTRPRREESGQVVSSIQFGTVPTLSDITPECVQSISDDPLKKVRGFFGEDQWGGVNAVYQLQDGWLGVLGHVAYYTTALTEEGGENNRHRKYAAIAFEFSPDTCHITHPVIILAREQIDAAAQPKRPDLYHVIFPGGLIFGEEADKTVNTVFFFYGLGDAHVGVAELPYPFHHALADHPNNMLFTMAVEDAREELGL